MQALLSRLEAWQLARGIRTQSCLQQLRQLQPRPTAAAASGGVVRGPKIGVAAGGKGVGGGGGSASGTAKAKAAAPPKAAVPDRYPARLVLSCWMMVHYPRVVFSKSKEVGMYGGRSCDAG